MFDTRANYLSRHDSTPQLVENCLSCITALIKLDPIRWGETEEVYDYDYTRVAGLVCSSDLSDSMTAMITNFYDTNKLSYLSLWTRLPQCSSV